MLTNIHIENYALIDCLDIDINEGLNIITGETGAGKSIILGAIGAALGAKINSDVIRAGEEYSFISVSFHINDADKLKALTELDAVDLSDGDIIVTRKIFPARSVFKINGVTVSAAQVRSLSSLIIDIHSQRDNLLLLKTENQLKLVDSFGDDEFRKLMDRQKSLYEEYTECNSKLANIGDDASLREREISLLQYEIKEIEEASLTVEEDEELLHPYPEEFREEHVPALMEKDKQGDCQYKLEQSDKKCFHLRSLYISVCDYSVSNSVAKRRASASV